MSAIKEDDDESEGGFSLGNAHIDRSLRAAAITRKSWQKTGIAIFESFGWVLARNTMILLSFLMVYWDAEIVSWQAKDGTQDGRFANDYVALFTTFTLLMLIDLILAFVFYGFKTLWKTRKEFYWEAIIQVGSIIVIIYYFSVDFDSTQQQINVVQFMTIVLFMRLPIISVLLMELPDILVIVETTKTMASPFLSILFSTYLFMETYCIVG